MHYGEDSTHKVTLKSPMMRGKSLPTMSTYIRMTEIGFNINNTNGVTNGYVHLGVP